MSKKQNKKLLTPEILKQALIGSVKKLDPRYMSKNPVMFVVETGFFISVDHTNAAEHVLMKILFPLNQSFHPHM